MHLNSFFEIACAIGLFRSLNKIVKKNNEILIEIILLIT